MTNSPQENPSEGRPNSVRPEAELLFEQLRAISLRSAERLKGREMLEEASLYDEGGLPS